MIRFGLCCQFVTAPIKFRTTTATYLKKLEGSRKEFLSELIFDNGCALKAAILFCHKLGIGSFRITSRFFPAYTHPEVGYQLSDLPNVTNIKQVLNECYKIAIKNKIRLTFHPDQFVVLNSPDKKIVDKSIQELEYQNEIANFIGADVLTLHAGGAYGDKKSALARFEEGFQRLSSSTKEKLALENDDKSYTPQDLLPLCQRLQIPLIYDIHHHRCLPDALSIEEATHQALQTWNREPLFHLSSPLNGWKGPFPSRHHEMIDPKDFPSLWLKINPLTIEIEAKGKEKAIIQLKKDLNLLIQSSGY